MNNDLVQILADIFGKPVYSTLVANSGALGGALRAFDVINQRLNSETSTIPCRIAAQPRYEYTAIYDAMFIRYTKLEKRIVNEIH